MKTSMKFLAIVAILAISLTATSVAFAKGGRSNRGDNSRTVTPGTGVVSTNLEVTLSNYMPAAIASVLHMDVDVVNDLLASGETFYTIALSQGYTADQIDVLMNTVRSVAIDLATAAGVITPEQAEWLLVNQGGLNMNSYGTPNYSYQPQTGTEYGDGTCVPVGSASTGLNRRGGRSR